MTDYTSSPQVGQGTEYTDNFTWSKCMDAAGSNNRESFGILKNTSITQEDMSLTIQKPPQNIDTNHIISRNYPSVYRETVIRRDERGHYVDPFKNIATKPNGRLLMYDENFQYKMHASQWNSELADTPGLYSFPTTTGLVAEIPWRKDMQWQALREVGQWPSGLWKQWEALAECPPYDGHDDQVEYSKYKA